MMNMEARNQYLSVLRRQYLATKARKEKILLLNEYCKNTGLNRKHVIRKINNPKVWDEKGKVKQVREK